MAKKRAKRKAKKPLVRSRREILFSHRTNRKHQSHIVTEKFKRSKSITKKIGDEGIKRSFRKLVKPKFQKYFNRNFKKGRKNEFYFRVLINHNLKGKRIKAGFSLRRVKFPSKKKFQERMKEFEKKLIKSMKKYLKRKDARSSTIVGVKIERIIKDVHTKTRAVKKPKRKKS